MPSSVQLQVALTAPVLAVALTVLVLAAALAALAALLLYIAATQSVLQLRSPSAACQLAVRQLSLPRARLAVGLGRRLPGLLQTSRPLTAPGTLRSSCRAAPCPAASAAGLKKTWPVPSSGVRSCQHCVFRLPGAAPGE